MCLKLRSFSWQVQDLLWPRQDFDNQTQFSESDPLYVSLDLQLKFGIGYYSGLNVDYSLNVYRFEL